MLLGVRFVLRTESMDADTILQMPEKYTDEMKEDKVGGSESSSLRGRSDG